MSLSVSSVLHYWSARYGPMPIVGGKPVHTRNSAAGWFDRQGILQSAIVNTPRFEWANVAGEERPILRLEAARTNSLVSVDDLSSGSWIKGGTTVNADVAIAPDGTLTADRLKEDSTTGGHYAYQTRTVALPFADGFFVKKDTARWIFVRTESSTSTRFTWFDLDNGVVGTVGHAAGRYGIQRIGNDGWYRVWAGEASGAGATQNTPMLGVTNADNSASHTGTSTLAIFVWRAHGENSWPVIGSALGSSTSRSADVMYWDHSPKPQAMAWYLRLKVWVPISETSLFKVFGSIGDNDGIVPYVAIRYGSGSVGAYHDNGGGEVGATAATTAVAGDSLEALLIMESDGKVSVITSVNEAAVVASSQSAAATIAAAWGARRLWLNGRGPSSGVTQADYAECKVVKLSDVVGATATDRMAELRAFELSAQGEVIS